MFELEFEIKELCEEFNVVIIEKDEMKEQVKIEKEELEEVIVYFFQ